MKGLVDEIIEIAYTDLDEQIPKFPKNRRFGLVVHLNGNKYEFLVNIKDSSDSLLVLAPPALDPDQIDKFRSRPLFIRNSWDFKESTIYFEDPTRYVYSLKSGWGIGTPNEWFLDNIKNIILKIANFYDIPNEKLIFFGSSSGGFTSIQLATMVKGSLAIGDCPQTDLRKWTYYWKNLKGTIFNQFSDEEINRNFAYRISLIDYMIKENYVPNLLFITSLNQNDIATQTVPFIQQLHKLPFNKGSFSRINILINPVEFHGPIFKADALRLLENIDLLKNNGNVFDMSNIGQYNNEINQNLDEVKTINDSANLPETREFPDTVCYDNATSNDHNDIWSLNGDSSLTRETDGSVMTGKIWASINLNVNDDINFPMGNYIFEFDVISVTGNDARLNFYDGNSNQIILSSGHYKIEIGDRIDVKKNNVTENIIFHDTSAQYFQLNFNINNDNVQLKFKNIRLYRI